MEKIEVRYQKLDYGYHKYIVYTNSQGQEFVAEAWQEGQKAK